MNRLGDGKALLIVTPNNINNNKLISDFIGSTKINVYHHSKNDKICQYISRFKTLGCIKNGRDGWKTQCVVSSDNYVNLPAGIRVNVNDIILWNLSDEDLHETNGCANIFEMYQDLIPNLRELYDQCNKEGAFCLIQDGPEICQYIVSKNFYTIYDTHKTL